MAEWAVSLKHKHIEIRGGKTITEGGRDDRVTDKLSTGHLAPLLSHNALHITRYIVTLIYKLQWDRLRIRPCGSN